MLTKCFNGANVFLSRNLVAPEIHAAVRDALTRNGARIFDNCDSSRNAPEDYHVISSFNHVKFDDLKAKGCNLIGPECVISCAKENRSLPKREGFTCCLAMDGVKAIASGFDKDEKAMIERLVTSMGGVLQNRASLDVNFVMVKNVLAPKYKVHFSFLRALPLLKISYWALTSLKKPVVTASSRVRTKEAKVFISLRCAEGNGKPYHTECLFPCMMTCSSQSIVAEGDKYLVAQKWGHVHIVAKKWFDQSIAKRSCLEEKSFPVQGPAISLKSGPKGHHSQDRGSTISPVPCTVMADSETTQSFNMSSTYSDSTSFNKGEGFERPASEPRDEKKFGCAVADDSQSDSDLYLSDCRIILVGFQAAEMRKLVGMHTFGKKCSLVWSEKKELKRLAALGVIHVVRAIWLEDCDSEKKEVPVTQGHTVSDIFLPMDSAWFNNASGTVTTSSDQVRSSIAASSMPTTCGVTDMATEDGTSVRRNGERELLTNIEGGNSVKEAVKFDGQDLLYSLNTGYKDQKRAHPNVDPSSTQLRRTSKIFRGTVFRFSSSFPEERRAEIIEWVNEGGGNIVDDRSKTKVQFIIGCHGQKQQASNCTQTTFVSTHWIRSCLEDGSIQDVGSHIIYSPLACNVPIRGFNEFRICVSQYEDKDKLLLRNLCFVLGAKFSEKLTKKATHLICKFTCGNKYVAACKWGIQPVTIDWISACIRQDAIVSTDPFRPKDATAHDREAGLCKTSQNPMHSSQMVCGDVASQLLIQSQVTKKLNGTIIEDNIFTKRAKLMEDDGHKQVPPAEICMDISANNVESIGKGSVAGEVPHIVPDVAAAIEDLLEQSNKIQDMVTSETPGSERNIFSTDPSLLVQDHLDSSSSLIPKHWLSRNEKQDNPSPQKVNKGPYDGFSETQTDSQMVGYEEDLSGIQMIIDKARARSSLT
ncbi:hypothetical protein Syun_003301 [Stephania yunnanensis]|uniref:BRCT domain-containing protein n=1 Tax=Stephania yunnanensis TaxID=152371 RepID=A0AAP0Q1H9_9MAGN